jgi:hypothetical protein
MPRVHSLDFETLESRRLLSTTHVAMAHAARGAAPALVLNGTVTVDTNPNASSTIKNGEGEITTSFPVAGQLGKLGPIHGFLDVTVDAHGHYAAPDELIIRDSKGSFIVAFTPPEHPTAGVVSYERPQVLLGGTGAYATAAERGTIGVTTNAAQTEVVSLTVLTRSQPELSR